MIQVFVSMIESKLTLFQVEMEGRFVETPKLHETHLREAPEVLDAIDVCFASTELVALMLNSVVPSVPQVHEACIGIPAIAMDRAVLPDLP